MPLFTVQRRSDGAVVHAYNAEAAEPWAEYPFDLFNHIPEPETPAPPRLLTKLDYLRRFTTVERIVIRAAAAQEPALADYLELLAVAQEINLDDHDTIAAAQMLEAAGLLSAGRVAEILA